MKLRFTILLYSFIAFLILLSCSLDEGVLSEYVVKEPEPTSEQPNDSTSVGGDGASEEPPEIEDSDFGMVEMESRTTAFRPIHDAYIQDGQGFDRELVRLAEDSRTSYLMFDLSEIDSIQGYITSASLRFIVDQDNGSGKIEVFKGSSNQWTEDTLSDTTAPEADTLLGVTQQVYDIEEQITIGLDEANLFPEVATLILKLEDGEAFAFASKENETVAGSELVVTYQAPVTADLIVIEDPVIEESEEETTGEETTEEEDTENSETTNAAPVAILSASETSGVAPLTVNFIGSSSTDDKGISGYSWDFKDGSSATTANAEHTFGTPGTYEVALTVSDEEGMSNAATVSITVTVPNEAPLAEASASVTTGTAPLKIVFSGEGSSDDNGITSYLWDFKDGNTATTANAENTFAGGGTFEVVFTVTDADGLSASQILPIVVTGANQAPVAKASASVLSGIAPLEVAFMGSESSDDNGIISHTWDFKDGNTASTANAKNTFTEAGIYDVVLKVTDADDLSATQTLTITVTAPNEEPVARVSASSVSGAVPFKVNFIGSESSDDKEVVSYAWDFRDGNTATTANPENTFTEAGTYNVVLEVTDAEGLTATAPISVVVTNPNTAPMATASASTLSGTAPLQVSFTGNNSSDDNGITSYLWDFKDGNTAATANAEHTFVAAGNYEVALTVTDAEGLSATEELSITVSSANAAPVARASANTLSGTVPLQVSFTGNNSTDDKGITSYLWDFKDGNTATTANAEHTFAAAGTYEATLSVTDADGLTSEDSVTITVIEAENEAPNAVANANTFSGNAPLTVSFTGSDSYDDKGISGYAWDFSGGTSSNADATYTFENPGTYEVSLTVYDNEGLSDTGRLTINVAEAPVVNLDCGTGGGFALDTGGKVWCWENMPIPEYTNGKGVSFAQGQLHVDSQCYERQVTNSGNRLKFRIEPSRPIGNGSCTEDFNMRAEIRTSPWGIRHNKGTEEWFGWSYTFGNDYIIDKNNQWKFFQVHPGEFGTSPQIGLEVIKQDQFIGHDAGEIYVTNATTSQDYTPTGITPRAGQTIDVVVHAVWDDASNGLLQVWIDGVKVHDRQVSTVFGSYPWAGNAKWGIYKWPWRSAQGVQGSLNQGITHLETYMGTLRMITRKPGDTDYGTDSYILVAPD